MENIVDIAVKLLSKNIDHFYVRFYCRLEQRLLLFLLLVLCILMNLILLSMLVLLEASNGLVEALVMFTYVMNSSITIAASQFQVLRNMATDITKPFLWIIWSRLVGFVGYFENNSSLFKSMKLSNHYRL